MGKRCLSPRQNKLIVIPLGEYAIAYGTSVQPFGHENRVASRTEADRVSLADEQFSLSLPLLVIFHLAVIQFDYPVCQMKIVVVVADDEQGFSPISQLF